MGKSVGQAEWINQTQVRDLLDLPVVGVSLVYKKFILWWNLKFDVNIICSTTRWFAL